MFSEKRGKRIPFFNLGFNNNWKDNLDDQIVNRIENSFRSEMLELKYLQI